MDGVLLIDKPSGPTSHDVVARLRRTSGEKSIGHTGTLDPRATGLLPLVMGRATRLASFLSGGDKTYDATVRLGFATDTDDADGTADRRTGVGAARRRRGRSRALGVSPAVSSSCRPRTRPRRSAGGRRTSWPGARNRSTLKPVTVTVHAIDRTGREGDRVHLIVTRVGGFLRAGARAGSGRPAGVRRPPGRPAADRTAGPSTSRTPCRSRTPSGWAADVAARVLAPAEALAGPRRGPPERGRPAAASCTAIRSARSTWRAAGCRRRRPRCR